VGTGGTVIGTARYLKEQNSNIKVIALEPNKSPAISENKTGPHKIQGIGANFVPENYDSSVVDEVILVDDENAFDTVKLLAAKE
ncbi:pyridoxal-phosphate dependent enzyme, partial [Acinetobacter baumannii]|nr:pyridoxal-phosphate dependent enzyme [Acinetobacter baumannii]